MSGRTGERGLSVIEAVVGMAITALILLAFTSVVDKTSAVEREAKVHHGVEAEVERVLGMVAADLRKASGASLQSGGSSLSMRQYHEIRTQGEPELVLSTVPIEYALAAGGRGLVRTEGDRVQTVAADVVGLQAFVSDQSLVDITVTVAVDHELYGLVSTTRRTKFAVLVP